MSIPSRCRAMVFDGPGKPLRHAEIPVAWPKAGEAIVQVELTTLGIDDFGVIAGKEAAPAPLILGHETVGTILALGDPPPREVNGAPLEIGDRIIWSRYVSCGECFYCRRRLPQECESLREYGRTSLGDPPRLSGGLAELVHLWPKTAIFKVPKSLRPAIAAVPHPGALAAAAIDAIIAPLTTALVLSEGEAAAQMGALLLSKRGVKVQFDSAEGDAESIQALNLKLTDGHGVDAVIDFRGSTHSVALAINACRIGGAISIIGAKHLSASFEASLEKIVQKNLRLTGIHRYKPEHLASSLEYVINSNAEGGFPFPQHIPARRPFSEVNEAIAEAEKDHSVRIAFEPDQD